LISTTQQQMNGQLEFYLNPYCMDHALFQSTIQFILPEEWPIASQLGQLVYVVLY